ncbi:hypothetical protein PC129_g23515 [Phytophthora cactorum]|uniref:RxLR effector protein n=1 Tax=Phytophthora cactorum TaxID=29920 RepID=A0A329RBT1_9STRA|nr:hypothetical protein Pcac1_g12976 [Phytophthora cactorum]KAG2810618.1 hypothetical protein PC113_g23742 [Phytophthora cactorum]KAG2871818.1 hypothetical protein PC114_g26709 [Phytophthora cactorum]KAG2875693.1 hypothetical protein PC115_g23834 [Phytophthora cactorum]KAG3201474.1 hypothetical protein PC129_g23515 [Phytophthora cactorum]
MRFYHVVLLALLALVAGIETLATATESSEIDIPKKEMLKITALIHHNGVNEEDYCEALIPTLRRET